MVWALFHPYEFKAAVEKVLGFTMTDEQWTGLKKDVKLDGDASGSICSFPRHIQCEVGTFVNLFWIDIL